MEAKDVKFSPTLEYNAADVTSPRAPDRIETPFFWTVPRSGGNVVRTIMSKCLRLAEASEYGAGSDEAVSAGPSSFILFYFVHAHFGEIAL